MPVINCSTPTERIGVVVWRLVAGYRPTTAEIAVSAGISRGAAWEMMARLSRVIPVCQVRVGRRLEWHIAPEV